MATILSLEEFQANVDEFVLRNKVHETEGMNDHDAVDWIHLEEVQLNKAVI